MNCQHCQKEIDAYLEGKPDPDLKVRIESHLRECRDCNELYRIQALADRIIAEEKELTVNPFLSTRVMAQIENSEIQRVTGLKGFLRPAFITVAMAAAIFTGVMIGSIPLRSQSNKPLPVELSLIDDTTLESIDLLSID
jgi:predicted anti-sigma-YlaC factor YlaD